MRFKPGVKLEGLRPEALAGMVVVDSVMQRFDRELTVTSITDGRHMPGSLHAKGRAFDCRFWDFPPAMRARLVDDLRAALRDEFDVVLESDHIHVEWDPDHLKGSV